jgi:hypothetical protein
MENKADDDGRDDGAGAPHASMSKNMKLKAARPNPPRHKPAAARCGRKARRKRDREELDRRSISNAFSASYGSSAATSVR